MCVSRRISLSVPSRRFGQDCRFQKQSLSVSIQILILWRFRYNADMDISPALATCGKNFTERLLVIVPMSSCFAEIESHLSGWWGYDYDDYILSYRPTNKDSQLAWCYSVTDIGVVIATKWRHNITYFTCSRISQHWELIHTYIHSLFIILSGRFSAIGTNWGQNRLRGRFPTIVACVAGVLKGWEREF